MDPDHKRHQGCILSVSCHAWPRLTRMNEQHETEQSVSPPLQCVHSYRVPLALSPPKPEREHTTRALLPFPDFSSPSRVVCLCREPQDLCLPC